MSMSVDYHSEIKNSKRKSNEEIIVSYITALMKIISLLLLRSTTHVNHKEHVSAAVVPIISLEIYTHLLPTPTPYINATTPAITDTVVVATTAAEEQPISMALLYAASAAVTTGRTAFSLAGAESSSE